MPQTLAKTKPVRLKPEENSFWVGRDGDGALFQYESRPKWNGFDFTPGNDGESVRRILDEWFPSIEAGCCVKVGPYGNVIDMRFSPESGGAEVP